MAERTVHILIEGLVQGVGFRAFVQQQAAGRGLTGWVRNRRTGAVEAMVAGSADDVGRFIDACQSGPSAARVDDLYVIADVKDASLGVFGEFAVCATV